MSRRRSARGPGHAAGRALSGRAEALTARLAGRGYTWACQTSVMELADRPDLLARMHSAGCRQIYFGMESGARRVLSQYKSLDLDRAIAVFERAASLAHNNSSAGSDALQTVVGFMVGHPDDDEQSIEETIALALQLRRLGLDTVLSIMQPYPGSLIHAHPERYGVLIENDDYADYLYPKANMSTRCLSRAAISSLYARGLLRIMSTY